MKSWYCIFIALCLLYTSIRADEELKDNGKFQPKFPKDIESIKTLKKFLKLVEQNKLNVSVIISKTDLSNDGSAQDLVALRMNLFPNSHMLTTSGLTKEDRDAFLKTAAKEKLTAATLDLDYKQEKDVSYTSNNPTGSADPLVVSSDILGSRDVDPLMKPKNKKNLGFHYTFITPTKEKTEIYGGDLEINIKESLGFEKAELNKINTISRKVLMGTAEDTVPEVLTTYLNNEFPDLNWNVFQHTGQDFWVNSEKFAILTSSFGDYVIFSAQ